MSPLTRTPVDSRSRRGLSLVAALLAAGVAALSLTACGVASPETSTSAPPATSTPTTGTPIPRPSASTGSRTANCTSAAILAALPGGAEMERFDCAEVGGTEWAAARVLPGPTVFFLQWTGTAWQAQDSDGVCGTASAGLPERLLSYCRPAGSSASPTPTGTSSSGSTRPTTPTGAVCTSRAIAAALPGGATVERFDCAKVGDADWAAARVQPGPTVFFLQWDGTAWQAEDSDNVCGAASAGLPERLLDYCRR